jgi:hypothetical protein
MRTSATFDPWAAPVAGDRRNTALPPPARPPAESGTEGATGRGAFFSWMGNGDRKGCTPSVSPLLFFKAARAFGSMHYDGWMGLYYFVCCLIEEGRVSKNL